jgi:hypothetical protein
MKKIMVWGLLLFCPVFMFAQNAALPRLAVVPFSVNTERQKAREDAIAIRNFVQSNMVSSGKYDVITRDEIDKLLENQRIQVSSISSAENIKKLQLQNINYIVTGTVDAIDNDYGVTISILDVSSGRFSHSTSQFMSNTSTDIYNKTAALVRNFQQGMSNEGETVVQTGSGQRPYSIGDRGPGGGFIFSSEGGFYMEVSPPIAGSYTFDQAVEVAKNYKGGGFNDWVLPGKDELDLIYKNLKQKGLGGFSNDWYWSSSLNTVLAKWYDNNIYVWLQNFSNGVQDAGNKNDTYSVRVVRSF